ncbi:MAG: metallophosphoesterase [Pirellulaceae bacterium]
MPKIWFISDTHNKHRELQVPQGVDAVMHCGDESCQRKTKWNEPEARDFFDWYVGLDIACKVFVPGNHSTSVELGIVRAEEYPMVQFLIHQSWQWQGLNIFGSPYTPWFFSWAYNIARPNLDALWAEIPDNTDILLTHGPPKGILDVTRDWRSKEPIHIGSKSLTRQVTSRIQPQLHAFGHLHDEEGIRNFGTLTLGPTQFLNCACCNLAGELVNHGQVIDLSAG